MSIHIDNLLSVSMYQQNLDASYGKAVNPPRRVTFVSYLLDGEYEYSFPSGKVQFKKDCLLTISPDDAFSALQIAPSRIISFMFISEQPIQSGVVDCSDDPRFSLLFRKLLQYKNLQHEGSYYMALSVVYEILALIAEKRDAQYYQLSKNLPFVEVRDYLLNNYSDPSLDTAALSAKYSFSDKYFRERFRELFGSTPTQYLIGLRLNEAARLLSSGTHNVKQAAEAVGISDIYYFSRLFKKRFLCPPSNFRNRVPKL